MQQIRYRCWQLWRALTGSLAPADWAFVAQVLTAPELVLFRQMPRYDQRHALDVARLLCTRVAADDPMVAMALLHDVGKMRDDGRALPLIWYGVIVVIRRWQWGYRVLMRVCEPVQRHAQHELRSAAMARRAGARDVVCHRLEQLASHQDDALMQLFEWADNQC